MIFFNAKL